MAADDRKEEPAMSIFFSKFNVSSQVFYRSKHSFGLVNLKPLVHVMVCSRRVTPRVSELSPEEVSDLFLTAQKVSRVLEKAYRADGMSMSCQDGEAAGQSVPHVHIHLIPRYHPDFPVTTENPEGKDVLFSLLERSESELQGDLAQTSAVGAEGSNGAEGGSAISKWSASKDVAGEEFARKAQRGSGKIKMPKDHERMPRSMAVMEKEARWMAGLFAEGSED